MGEGQGEGDYAVLPDAFSPYTETTTVPTRHSVRTEELRARGWVEQGQETDYRADLDDEMFRFAQPDTHCVGRPSLALTAEVKRPEPNLS
jgi:hypothetical protein